jgi:hypothetical protein
MLDRASTLIDGTFCNFVCPIFARAAFHASCSKTLEVRMTDAIGGGTYMNERLHGAPQLSAQRDSEVVVSRESWAATSAVEVAIHWGSDSLLHVAHPSLRRGFWIGDGRLARPGRSAARGGKVDFVVDPKSLGIQRLPLVLCEEGQPFFVIPRGASGDLERAGDRIGFDELDAQALLRPVAGFDGARKHPLVWGARARIQLGELSFSLRCVAAATRVGFDDRSGLAVRDHGWTLASAALHAALFVVLSWLPGETPPLALNGDASPRETSYQARTLRVQPAPAALEGAPPPAAVSGVRARFGDHDHHVSGPERPLQAAPNNARRPSAADEALERERSADPLSGPRASVQERRTSARAKLL